LGEDCVADTVEFIHQALPNGCGSRNPGENVRVFMEEGLAILQLLKQVAEESAPGLALCEESNDPLALDARFP